MNEVEPPTREASEDEPGGPMVVYWIARSHGAVTTILAGGKLRIGRAPESDVRLAGEEISRAHAEIFLSGRAHVLRDLGSRNGTTVNGRPIAESTLRIDDVIQMGVWKGFVLPRSQVPEPRLESVSGLDDRLGVASRIWGLTAREKDVLGWIVDAKPNAVIAECLGITAKTVEVHLTRIYEKAQVDGRLDLLRVLSGLERQ
jgi:DNA-binding CsgD family transcriptional regulator